MVLMNAGRKLAMQHQSLTTQRFSELLVDLDLLLVKKLMTVQPLELWIQEVLRLRHN